MLKEEPVPQRELPTERIDCDLVVVGGGLAGVCCAVTAARAGIRATLIQDRPVLGGNASSEIRMVAIGASASMGNNNRWAREGGVIDEFLVENVFRNPEGNPLLSDTILLEMVVREPNVTLLLNTAVFEVGKHDARTIGHVRGFCPQNSTLVEVHAPLFCDASGDGVLGFLAGAAFRMGAETKDEFDEPLAPDKEYGELLGHTIYFQTKDTGKPVRFVPPDFALDDITKITRWERINATDQGCQYWWLEYGGRLDTVHQTEAIKWELWRIVYGIWNYIKNSGKFPEAETLTLEWVGAVPGKRESRRFEGDYILTQRDVVQRRRHDDVVSYGGWSLDLHPADGIYSDRPPCDQWHAKGVYPIPFRTLYSRNIRNLLLAGRIISASHVAFGSTRVMATCAHNAQAVGMAAAICRRENLLPADLAAPERIGRLQRALARTGQYIPGYRLEDPDDLARDATITASSRLRLRRLGDNGPLLQLERPWAMLLPVAAGPVSSVSYRVDVAEPTRLEMQLRASAEPDGYTPEVILGAQTVELPAGTNRTVTADFGVSVDRPRYVFACLMRNPAVSVRCSRQMVTGVVAVTHRGREEVSKGSRQSPPEGLGVDTFEFWRPVARPEGCNLAVTLDPPLDVFGPESVANGVVRPTHGPNAWVADPLDANPTLTLRWKEPQTIGRIELTFDTDRDNPLYSVLFGHPDSVMPQCVRRWRILDAAGRVLAQCDDNHQTQNTIRLASPVTTDCIHIELTAPSDQVPAALFEVRCYGA
jgi:hypothetical protein